MKKIDNILEHIRKLDQIRRLQHPPGEPGDYDREMPRETHWDEMSGPQDGVFEENVRRLSKVNL